MKLVCKNQEIESHLCKESKNIQKMPKNLKKTNESKRGPYMKLSPQDYAIIKQRISSIIKERVGAKGLIKDNIQALSDRDFTDLFDDYLDRCEESSLHKRKLKQFKKKIIKHLTKEDKDETRGAALVLKSTIFMFKEGLRRVFSMMAYRSFQVFRRLALPLLAVAHELQQEKSKRPRKFDAEKSCSKHFWYDFLNDNPDIKAEWKSIPKKRTYLASLKRLHSHDQSISVSSSISTCNSSVGSPSNSIMEEKEFDKVDQEYVSKNEWLFEREFNEDALLRFFSEGRHKEEELSESEQLLFIRQSKPMLIKNHLDQNEENQIQPSGETCPELMDTEDETN